MRRFFISVWILTVASASASPTRSIPEEIPSLEDDCATTLLDPDGSNRLAVYESKLWLAFKRLGIAAPLIRASLSHLFRQYFKFPSMTKDEQWAWVSQHEDHSLVSNTKLKLRAWILGSEAHLFDRVPDKTRPLIQISPVLVSENSLHETLIGRIVSEEGFVHPRELSLGARLTKYVSGNYPFTAFPGEWNPGECSPTTNFRNNARESIAQALWKEFTQEDLVQITRLLARREIASLPRQPILLSELPEAHSPRDEPYQTLLSQASAYALAKALQERSSLTFAFDGLYAGFSAVPTSR